MVGRVVCISNLVLHAQSVDTSGTHTFVNKACIRVHQSFVKTVWVHQVHMHL